MKKILTSLALIGAFATGSHAQEVDLKPFAIMIPNQVLGPNKPISNTGIINNQPAPADSIQGAIIYGVDSAGGNFLSTDTFIFFGPWVAMGDDGTMSFYRGFRGNGDDVDATDGYAIISYLGNDWVATTDSIKTLLNIQYFEQNGVGHPFEDMLYRRSELVNGQTYGWYAHMRPYPNWDDAPYVDPDPTNNWGYTPVIWQAGTTSIQELLSSTHYTPLAVYPNPTVEQLNFKLEFAKTNKSTVVRVLDLSGRALSSKAMGGANAGTQEYSYNVSKLSAGTYTLQVITDNAIYTSKFVKK